MTYQSNSSSDVSCEEVLVSGYSVGLLEAFSLDIYGGSCFDWIALYITWYLLGPAVRVKNICCDTLNIL